MDTTASLVHQGQKDKRRAKIAAALFALLLFFLILYPFWSYTFPPPGQEGILVSFGEIEIGGSDALNESQQEQEVETPDNANKEKQQSEVFQKNEKTPPKVDSKVAAIKTKSATEEVSEVVVKEKTTAKKVVAESVVKPTEQEVAAQKAADEAKKKAEYEQAKKQFGSLLSKGVGQNADSGNAGDPAGDPNTDALSGISKGDGKIGGGLANRGLVFAPEIDENSQKAGKVVVRVCVNNKGEVIEAKYTQKGSTTTDTDLMSVAIAGAKRYKFSRSPIDKQCGTVTIEFKLK